MDQEDMIITCSLSNSTSRNLFDRYNHLNGICTRILSAVLFVIAKEWYESK